MKAFLLAAGVGSRLRPITDNIPKCLVPINGHPLLYYWFRLFEKHGVDQVLINLHYLPDKVREFFAHHSFDVDIDLFYEESLLGSGGTIKENYDFIKNENAFLICYADNLTNVDLSSFIRFHHQGDQLLSIAVFETNVPKECGILELDSDSSVISFEEKPTQPKSNLANAGLYIASPEIKDYFPENGLIDFGYHVLPKLVGKMKAFVIEGFHMDIGTIDNYRKAQYEWKY
ncbi:NTP transferase domain-containing protein [candidate division KSB1 bacterium]|nr:NTP transferase domain-containing protein [candidate division KSB1 bacterium]